MRRAPCTHVYRFRCRRSGNNSDHVEPFRLFQSDGPIPDQLVERQEDLIPTIGGTAKDQIIHAHTWTSLDRAPDRSYHILAHHIPPPSEMYYRP